MRTQLIAYDDHRDDDDDETRSGTWLLLLAVAAAEHPGVQPEARHHRGDHREEARHRHHEDVAVRDVRELVGENRLELLLLEPLPQPARDRDGGVLRVAAGREGVRDIGLNDGDPRLRQVGHRAEPFDHRVKVGRLLGGDDLRAGRSERDLVGGVVLEEGDADDDHEHRRRGRR